MLFQVARLHPAGKLAPARGLSLGMPFSVPPAVAKRRQTTSFRTSANVHLSAKKHVDLRRSSYILQSVIVE